MFKESDGYGFSLPCTNATLVKYIPKLNAPTKTPVGTTYVRTLVEQHARGNITWAVTYQNYEVVTVESANVQWRCADGSTMDETITVQTTSTIEERAISRRKIS